MSVGKMGAHPHEPGAEERSFGMESEKEWEERRDKEVLDRVTDAVLAYKPKAKTKAAKRRARRKKRKAN